MKWKPINSNEKDTRQEIYYGNCPLKKQKAEITVSIVAKTLCRTDLHKTYCESGRKCSLLLDKLDSCLKNCPLVTDSF